MEPIPEHLVALLVVLVIRGLLLDVVVGELITTSQEGGTLGETVNRTHTEYNAALLDPGASDVDRLAAVVAEFPDVEDAVRPLREFAEALQADPLTRQLLLTVYEDQVTTLAWFHRAWQARKEQ